MNRIRSAVITCRSCLLSRKNFSAGRCRRCHFMRIPVPKLRQGSETTILCPGCYEYHLHYALGKCSTCYHLEADTARNERKRLEAQARDESEMQARRMQPTVEAVAEKINVVKAKDAPSTSCANCGRPLDDEQQARCQRFRVSDAWCGRCEVE